MSALVTRPLRDDERTWMRETLRERWPHELLVGRGRVRAPSELSALVATQGGDRVGLLTYAIEDGVAELVTLDALRPGIGVGASLVTRLADLARAEGARRLVAMVTNDNSRGLGYYQRLGFRLSELRPGAIDELRPDKPWIPAIGQDDIPIRDEIELVRDLPATS